MMPVGPSGFKSLPGRRLPLVFGDDELEGSVGLGEARDLHIDEAGRFSSRDYNSIRDLGAFLWRDDPDAAIRPDRGPQRFQLLEVARGIGEVENQVGVFRGLAGELGRPLPQIAEEILVLNADDGDRLARFYARLVQQRFGVVDLLGPRRGGLAQLETSGASWPLDREHTCFGCCRLDLLERDLQAKITFEAQVVRLEL